MKKEKEKESIYNLQFVHDTCACEHLEEFQKTFDGTKLTKGDYVKTALTVNADGDVEHMWVMVDTVLEDKIIGTLDNIPFANDATIELGDTIVVDFNKISMTLIK